MRAVLINSFGDPANVVHLGEAEIPEPGAGELRVRLLKSPIHNHDLAIIRGIYGYKPALPAIPGSEGLGIVDALGAGVQGFSVGQKVAVPAGVPITRALAQAGVWIEVSCEQGVCGTCMCSVIEGVPDHRDNYLTEDEKATNDQILPCCSRSKTAMLVLDL